MQKETAFKIKFRKRLDAIPGLYVTKIQQVAIRGIPDLLICYKGKFIAYELKVPPNKLKVGGLQEWHLNAISAAGGVAKVVTPLTMEETLKELLNG